MKFSEMISRIPKSGIRRIFDLAVTMSDVINLSIGEPDFDTPEHIKQAAKKAIDEGFTKYTANAGIPELRDAISEKLKRENGIEADPEREIMVTTGASQAILLSLQVLLKRGEEVLIPSPAFVVYIPQVIIAGGVPVEVETREEEEFRTSAEDLEKHVGKKTKAIILNSPCNPTGAILDKKCLEGIADMVVSRNLYVITDEVYEKFIYEGKHCSIASLNGLKERVVTVNGFSKTYAMTGWRLGYAAASEEIISEMVKLQMYNSTCQASFVQKAAVEALRGSQNFVKKMREEYSRRKELIYRGLSQIDGISPVKPKGAFYIFPNVRNTKRSSQEVSEYLLKEAKVATVPGAAFGKYGEGYIRLSYAAAYDDIEKAIGRMTDAFNKILP